MHYSSVLAKMLYPKVSPWRASPQLFHKFWKKKKKRKCPKLSFHLLKVRIFQKWQLTKQHSLLTYCSPHVKSSEKHWLLRKACATYHLPGCTGILLCGSDDCLSDNATWFHFDDHCFPVPGTCTINASLWTILSSTLTFYIT